MQDLLGCKSFFIQLHLEGEKEMKRLGTLVLIGLLCASLPMAHPFQPATYSATQKSVAKAQGQVPKRLSAYDKEVNQLLSQMTLEEKIGQMTQAEQDALKDWSDIETYYLGSVLSGGNSDPKEGNSLQAWTDLYDRCQSHALKSRLKIPILYGVDAVHGHNNVLGAVIFPHNIGLGCTRNPKLVEKASRITAEEVRA